MNDKPENNETPSREESRKPPEKRKPLKPETKEMLKGLLWDLVDKAFGSGLVK
jgi:hypothetical protein